MTFNMITCYMMVLAISLGLIGAPTPLLTIQSSDGDIIDCVKIHEQPAFNNPLLRNHIVQEAPTTKWNMMNNMKGKNIRQVWNQNGTSCPDQTVPIRRSRPGFRHVGQKKHVTDPRRSRHGIPYYAVEMG